MKQLFSVIDFDSKVDVPMIRENVVITFITKIILTQKTRNDCYAYAIIKIIHESIHERQYIAKFCISKSGQTWIIWLEIQSK